MKTSTSPRLRVASLLNALTALTILTAVTATINAQAQASDKPAEAKSGQRPPHEPPPQAYVDCKGKKEGDAVQIITPRDEKIPAVCTSSAKGLFARPEHPPRRDKESGDNPPPKK